MHPIEDDETSRAPGELEILRSFLSLHDHGADPEVSAPPSTDTLARWFRERAGVSAKRFDAAELDRAREVLEVLRAGIGAEHRGPTAPLDRAAIAARLELRFPEAGPPSLVPAAGGVAGALGRLLSIAFVAQLDGSWSHLKACRNDACRAIFYDRSRNGSGRWCSMRACGNRAKVRRFRERRAAEG